MARSPGHAGKEGEGLFLIDPENLYVSRPDSNFHLGYLYGIYIALMELIG
jgi:hypothetical protein